MGNIGTALGQTANGSLPLCRIGRYLTELHIERLPCTTTDWEHTWGPTRSRVGRPLRWRTTRGFHCPSPIKCGTLYQPTVLGVFTPTFIDYNWKSPYMIQYNASVQQQLPWNMALGVAYVGNHGVHLPMVRDGNPIPPTSFGPCGDPASVCVDGKVPFWDQLTARQTTATSTRTSAATSMSPRVATSRYNALQVVLQKRTSHGLEFQGAYTRSLRDG